MRSKWKFVYVNPFFFRKVFLRKLSDKTKYITVWNKRMYISRDCLESLFKVYNGKKFQTIPVKRNMLGSVLGQFVLTKRITRLIHAEEAPKKTRVVKVVLKSDSPRTIKRLNLLSLLEQEGDGPYNKSN